MRTKPTIYDDIDEFVTYHVIQERMADARMCWCYTDPKHRHRFEDDPVVHLEATPFMDKYEPNVMIRAERACGLIMYIDAKMWGIDTARGAHFWYLIFRRVEKQCASLYHAPFPQPEPIVVRHKPTHPDRKRHSQQWRSRR